MINIDPNPLCAQNNIDLRQRYKDAINEKDRLSGLSHSFRFYIASSHRNVSDPYSFVHEHCPDSTEATIAYIGRIGTSV